MIQPIDNYPANAMRTVIQPDSNGRFLLPLQEVAKRLCMSRSELYRKIKAGLFPEPIKQGRLSFYALSDVEAYLSKLKRTLA